MWPMWPALPSRPLEQSAVEHDAAADARRHDHRDVVVVAGRRADPPLAQRQRLRVVVHERRQPGQRGQAGPQGKGPPPRDVERRHLLAAGAHRAPAPRAADHQAVPRSHRSRDLADHARQVVPEHLGLVRTRGRRGRSRSPFQQGAVDRNEAGGHLGAADVDGESEVCHGRIVSAERTRAPTPTQKRTPSQKRTQRQRPTRTKRSQSSKPIQRSRRRLRSVFSSRAGGSGSGTSRGRH